MSVAPAMTYITKATETASGFWNARLPLLPALDMELTERCNNRCIHCYINQPADDIALAARELSPRQIRDCLAQAVDLGCLTVRFTGGEPLLRDDFPEIYRTARRFGLRVQLLTNATRITPSIADLLQKMPPLMPVEITLYGLSPETEETVSRNHRSLAAATRGRKLLSERGVPYILKWTALRENMQDLPLFLSLHQIESAGNSQPEITTQLDLRARRDSLGKNKRIASLRLHPYERIPLLAKNLRHSSTRDMAPHAVTPARLFQCGAGTSIAIDAYGKAQMCTLLRHPETVYDLNNGSMRDALTSFFPLIRGKKPGNPAYLSGCAVCSIRHLCGQCPARSWMEHGTLDTPVAYLCRCAHLEAIHQNGDSPDINDQRSQHECNN